MFFVGNELAFKRLFGDGATLLGVSIVHEKNGSLRRLKEKFRFAGVEIKKSFLGPN